MTNRCTKGLPPTKDEFPPWKDANQLGMAMLRDAPNGSSRPKNLQPISKKSVNTNKGPNLDCKILCSSFPFLYFFFSSVNSLLIHQSNQDNIFSKKMTTNEMTYCTEIHYFLYVILIWCLCANSWSPASIPKHIFVLDNQWKQDEQQ